MQHLINEQTKTKIKTFVFQSAQNFYKSYKGFLIIQRQQVFMRDCIKIWVLALGVVLCFWTYLYFINITSTRGYFLKLAQEQLNANNAKSDIIKLEIVKEKKENRDLLSLLSQKHLPQKPYTIIISGSWEVQDPNSGF